MDGKIPPNFPITRKYLKYVYLLANNYHVEHSDAIQEALIIEYKAIAKIADLKHRENYWRQVVRYVLMEVSSYHWWKNENLVSLNDVLYDDDGNEREVLDSIVSLRSFDEMFYDDLVRHLSILIREVDERCAEMFLYRVKLDVVWDKIHKTYYRDVKHNAFYRDVVLIRDCVASFFERHVERKSGIVSLLVPRTDSTSKHAVSLPKKVVGI